MRKNRNAPSRLVKVALGAASAMALGLAVPGVAQDADQEQEAQQQEEERDLGEDEAAAEENGEAIEQPEPAEPGQAELGEEQQDAFHVGEADRRTSYSIGTVQGTVTQLDFDEGYLILRSAGGDIELRARPMDITNLSPGDVVAVDFNNYDGVLWLQPEETDLEPAAFAQFGTLTGNVTDVDKALGTITVRGETMRAHPDQLLAVVPGQFVSLGYANIAGQNWVAGVERAQTR